MTSIDPTNLKEYERLESMFWHTLRQTFSRVLDKSTEPVDYYRASLSKASPYERLLALHDDPLDVAAVLAGVTLTPDIMSRYEALLSKIYPEQAIYNPLYPGSEVPRQRARETPRTSGRSVFIQIMKRLGHAPAELKGKIVAWKAATIVVGLALALSIVGQMTGEGIIVTAIVGLIAGWIASKVVSGTRLTLISDIVVGILGALVATWLFPRLGIHLGAVISGDINVAIIGAVVFLIILNLFDKRVQ
jgi:uncharacterized membrane protein YeaQ/YmgE (transglycosylase-associated protein family)